MPLFLKRYAVYHDKPINSQNWDNFIFTLMCQIALRSNSEMYKYTGAVGVIPYFYLN